MKATSFCVLIALTGLILAGCSKPESATESGAKATTDAAGTDLAKTVETAKAAGEKIVADASQQVQDTAATATKQVQDATAAASTKGQELIDKAKKLIAENKYQDASAILQELTGYKLTPEQEKLVLGLKDEITKALASQAAKDAAGNILGGKK
jgi:hypothetical protein